MNDLKHLIAANDNVRSSVTDRIKENRRVKEAFRDSFLGALPMWEKVILLEYVNKIPVREGR